MHPNHEPILSEHWRYLIKLCFAKPTESLFTRIAITPLLHHRRGSMRLCWWRKKINWLKLRYFTACPIITTDGHFEREFTHHCFCHAACPSLVSKKPEWITETLRPVSLQHLLSHQHLYFSRYSRWANPFYIEIHLSQRECGLCYQMPLMSQDLFRRTR